MENVDAGLLKSFVGRGLASESDFDQAGGDCTALGIRDSATVCLLAGPLYIPLKPHLEIMLKIPDKVGDVLSEPGINIWLIVILQQLQHPLKLMQGALPSPFCLGLDVPLLRPQRVDQQLPSEAAATLVGSYTFSPSTNQSDKSRLSRSVPHRQSERIYRLGDQFGVVVGPVHPARGVLERDSTQDAHPHAIVSLIHGVAILNCQELANPVVPLAVILVQFVNREEKTEKLQRHKRLKGIGLVELGDKLVIDFDGAVDGKLFAGAGDDLRYVLLVENLPDPKYIVGLAFLPMPLVQFLVQNFPVHLYVVLSIMGALHLLQHLRQINPGLLVLDFEEQLVSRLVELFLQLYVVLPSQVNKPGIFKIRIKYYIVPRYNFICRIVLYAPTFGTRYTYTY